MVDRLFRLIRHHLLSLRPAGIPAAALRRVTERVEQSESRHSGEIRICIERSLPIGFLLAPVDTPTMVRQRALALFGELRVWDTEYNNGVLIYLLLAERRIELVADRGLNHHVDSAQWQAVVQGLGQALHQQQWEAGLAHATDEVTALLERHFPLAQGAHNPNELPDLPFVT